MAEDLETKLEKSLGAVLSTRVSAGETEVVELWCELVAVMSQRRYWWAIELVTTSVDWVAPGMATGTKELAGASIH